MSVSYQTETWVGLTCLGAAGSSRRPRCSSRRRASSSQTEPKRTGSNILLSGIHTTFQGNHDYRKTALNFIHTYIHCITSPESASWTRRRCRRRRLGRRRTSRVSSAGRPLPSGKGRRRRTERIRYRFLVEVARLVISDCRDMMNI